MPLGGSGSSVTPAIPLPLGSTFSRQLNSAVLLNVLLISLPFSRLLRFNICVVAVAYRGLLLFGIGFVARSGFLVIKYHLGFEGIPLVA